jgi:hypothetical protein
METFITDGKEGWFKWETAFHGLYIHASPYSHLTLSPSPHGVYCYSATSHASCPARVPLFPIFISLFKNMYWRYWLQVCTIRLPRVCSVSDHSDSFKPCRCVCWTLTRECLRSKLFWQSLMSHHACCYTCYKIQLMHYSHFKTHSTKHCVCLYATKSLLPHLLPFFKLLLFIITTTATNTITTLLCFLRLFFLALYLHIFSNYAEVWSTHFLWQVASIYQHQPERPGYLSQFISLPLIWVLVPAKISPSSALYKVEMSMRRVSCMLLFENILLW